VSGRLEGRVAAVLGGASGMGLAISRRFAAEGAFVYIADLNAAAADDAAAEVRDTGGDAIGVAVDAVSTASIAELYGRIEAEHGVLHVLHSQVGMPGAGGLEVSEEEFDRSIDVNVRSAFFASTLALPLLRRAGGKGSITLLASTAALVGSPLSPLYSLTKGAVVSYTRSLALATATDGIRVNVLCPGPVDTPMLPQFFGRDPGADVQDLMSGFVSVIPMQRPATPEEIAGAAAFLASDDAGFITGIALPIDGGQTAK